MFVETTANDFHLDQLIIVGEYRGWVRYIGPVATSRKATTQWLGIEWELENRGKHDGSIEKDGEVLIFFLSVYGGDSCEKQKNIKVTPKLSQIHK